MVLVALRISVPGLLVLRAPQKVLCWPVAWSSLYSVALRSQLLHQEKWGESKDPGEGLGTGSVIKGIQQVWQKGRTEK